MLEAILCGAMVLSWPALAYASMRAKRSQRARWEAAVRAAGLKDVVLGAGRWSKDILTAWAGPHLVRIKEYAHSKENRGTRVVIEGNSGLTLRAEKDVTALQRVIGPYNSLLAEAPDTWAEALCPSGKGILCLFTDP